MKKPARAHEQASRLTVTAAEDRARQARVLYEADLSLAEVGARFGIAPSTVMLDVIRAGGTLRSRTKPSARTREKMRATHAQRTREVANEIPVGVCGTPGCTNPGCSIRYGKSHCGCGADAPIARYSWRERGRVKGKPMLYAHGHGHCTGPKALRGPPTPRGANLAAARAELEAYRDEHGLWTVSEAAAELKVSPYSVSYYARRGLLAPVPSPVSGMRALLFRPADVRELRTVLLERWRQASDALQGPPPVWLVETWSGSARRAWKLRLAPKPGPHKKYAPEKAARVIEIKRRHPDWGYGTIACEVGLTKKQVRTILASHI